jgi:lambda family phage portal protein
MNLLDRAIATVSPTWAVKRVHARSVLAYHEAVKTTRLRRARTKDGRGDQIVGMSAAKLRIYARDMERNHDISRGALNRLVQNIVGPRGITIEPQPRTKGGEIHETFAREILALWRDFGKRPEVTWQHDWPSSQRLLCRSWMRDGESFAQRLMGSVPGLDHGTEVPYSIEMMESDSVPLDYYDEAHRITQGVERNAWGRPVGYWLYKIDPAKLYNLTTIADLKRVGAERMLHVKLVDRMLQARGISVFASVLTRLDDVKDYEDSERIAAKVAASMAAYIKKGAPDNYVQKLNDDGTEPEPRNMKFRPGVVFDDLLLGEEIGTINTNRPNTGLEAFRQGQLRAVAAGIDVGYSSLSRYYDGNYNSQRQELIDQWAAYGVLQSEFGARVVVPVYGDFLNVAILSGRLKVPTDLDPASLDDAILVGPQMPWIDPVKEMLANKGLERAGYKPAQQTIRERGGNPNDVFEQIRLWRKKADAAELVFDSDPAKTANAGTAQDYLREQVDNQDEGGSNAATQATQR